MLELTPEGEFIILNEARKVYLIDPLPNDMIYEDMLRVMKNKEEVTIRGEVWYIVGVESLRPGDTKCGIMVDRNKPE